MKRNILWLGMLAIALTFGMTGCPNGNDPDPGNSPGGGTLITPPSVGELPAFPAGSTPAATRADAEAILKELRQTRLIEDLQDEIWEVRWEHESDDGNYSFSNKSPPGSYAKVSASRTENNTDTGGFKAEDDLYDSLNAGELTWDELEEARNNIQYARNDRSDRTLTSNSKGELTDDWTAAIPDVAIPNTIDGTSDTTESGVTIAQGSTFEKQEKYSYNGLVTKAGTFTTVRGNYALSYKWQEVAAFTVTTSCGSIKVILDTTREDSGTANNFLTSADGDGEGTKTGYRKYSGSLKVYGNNNALLINHQIVDRASYDFAFYLIEYDPYPFDSAYAAGATVLAVNTITNGNISPWGERGDWYSINVTNGQKYHLWWSDGNTNQDYTAYRIRVRGYDSNGNAFLDTGFNDLDYNISWYLDWQNYVSFTATSTGTVYIIAYPKWSDGTYAIAYNTTGTSPMRSASSVAPASPFGDAPSMRRMRNGEGGGRHFRP